MSTLYDNLDQLLDIFLALNQPVLVTSENGNHLSIS